MSVAEVGLDIAARADMDAVRAKSLELSDLFIDLVESRLSEHPIEIVTPREHEHRGSQVSIAHPQGYEVMSALIARGIIGDYREPSVLRFRSEEHTSELQSRGQLVCRLLLEKKNKHELRTMIIYYQVEQTAA